MLMENSAYFAALDAALAKAQRSIVILGWQFDPRTRLDPETRLGDRAEEIGHRLRMMVKTNVDLDVQLLLWKSPLLIAASQGFFPQRGQRWFRKRMADFRLDHPGPLGACHHQKVVIIDDRLAFCGGGDIAVDRWDTEEHLEDDPRRCMPSGRTAPARHEVMAMMDGAAARALGDLARERWTRATGERTFPLEVETDDPWPDHVAPDLLDVDVGIARTQPGRTRAQDIRENEALHLECIARARRLIYLENQYFTSPVIAAALAARLEEPDGPEIVLISTGRSPSWFDSMTMDPARAAVLHRLEAADHRDRFCAFYPKGPGGGPLIVHSKVTIIDDELIRIGSTNLNNRSMGFDTECDVAAAPGPAGVDAIRAFRHRLIAHFMGIDTSAYAAAEVLEGAVGRTIRALDSDRMAPLEDPPGRLARFMDRWHIGDPVAPEDSLMPWRRLGKRARPVLPPSDRPA